MPRAGILRQLFMPPSKFAGYWCYNKAVFVGQAYKLRYKSQMQGTVRIMTTTQWMGREVLDGYRKQDKDREEKIETENQSFNGQFDVYATNSHTAFYVVTPLVMERLMEMKKRYGLSLIHI